MAEGGWDKWHPNQKVTERNQKGDYYGLNVCVLLIHMLKPNNMMVLCDEVGPLGVIRSRGWGPHGQD